MAKRIIRIGPAGWSYIDWEGVVYPQKPGKSFDPLEYLARFFNTIEINSSFYRPPATSTSASASGYADAVRSKYAPRSTVLSQRKRPSYTARSHAP